METTSQKTIFYQTHLDHGAKMAPFGGFIMPIQYEGIIKEHMATRTKATLFDTCHMGEFIISGTTACTDLEDILSCSVVSIKIGQCKYGFICNETGGVIDDQILYRLGDSEYMMVVNSSTQRNDFEWIKSIVSPETSLVNISTETAKIDLQGPASVKIVEDLVQQSVLSLPYYGFMRNTFEGNDIILSRTGYTGEVGFEIYSKENTARLFLQRCLEKGATLAGLGARDTLRLEMGYPLYGHELNAETNAAESGFTRAIDKGKKFIGSSIVCDPAHSKKLLVGLMLSGRRAARHGDTIFNKNGTATGTVTSGSFSPSLQKAIALGYVNKEFSIPGTEVEIAVGGSNLLATVTKLPFYTGATGRKPLKELINTI